MKTPRLPLVLAVLVLSAGALAGCATAASGLATASSSTAGPLIAPVTMDAGDLQGATVALEIGQVLNINTGSLAVESYSGVVEDPAVAEFTAGRKDGGATFNPGVTGLAKGSTQVTLSNSDGGIQDVVFTVSVGTSG